MRDELTRKKQALESCLERYNEYKRFADVYKHTKSLEEYASKLSNSHKLDAEEALRAYESGNSTLLLQDLYDRLLAEEELKNKLSYELKQLLDRV